MICDFVVDNFRLGRKIRFKIRDLHITARTYVYTCMPTTNALLIPIANYILSSHSVPPLLEKPNSKSGIWHSAMRCIPRNSWSPRSQFGIRWTRCTAIARRETALQGALVLAKSGRRELGNNISRTI